jgi:hypothetical protein
MPLRPFVDRVVRGRGHDDRVCRPRPWLGRPAMSSSAISSAARSTRYALSGLLHYRKTWAVSTRKLALRSVTVTVTWLRFDGARDLDRGSGSPRVTAMLTR